MTKEHHTEAITDDTEFITELKALIALHDRPKTLTIYALLQHDPYDEYTESEIQEAIQYLRDYDGDNHTPMIESAVQWLQRLPRAEQITA